MPARRRHVLTPSALAAPPGSRKPAAVLAWPCVDPAAKAIAATIAYHERTKHHLHRYAASPGYLDWATQPDPFRSYAGAPGSSTAAVAPPSSTPPYDDALRPGAVAAAAARPQDVSASSSSSRWGSPPGSRRARAGRCAPTPRAATSTRPRATRCVPAARRRSTPASTTTRRATTRSSAARRSAPKRRTALVALLARRAASSWVSRRFTGAKPGSTASARSAIASTTSATRSPRCATRPAALGWRALVCDGLGDDRRRRPCSASIARRTSPTWRRPTGSTPTLRSWSSPAVSSRMPVPRRAGRRAPPRSRGAHTRWRLDRAGQCAQPLARRVGSHRPGRPCHVAARTGEPPMPRPCAPLSSQPRPRPSSRAPAATLILQRRSAVALDGRTSIAARGFYAMLDRLLPRTGRRALGRAALGAPAFTPPSSFTASRGLSPGLYALRARSRHARLRSALRGEFACGSGPRAAPATCRFFSSCPGDCRAASQIVSCHQDDRRRRRLQPRHARRLRHEPGEARRLVVPAALLGGGHPRSGALPRSGGGGRPRHRHRLLLRRRLSRAPRPSRPRLPGPLPFHGRRPHRGRAFDHVPSVWRLGLTRSAAHGSGRGTQRPSCGLSASGSWRGSSKETPSHSESASRQKERSRDMACWSVRARREVVSAACA